MCDKWPTIKPRADEESAIFYDSNHIRCGVRRGTAIQYSLSDSNYFVRVFARDFFAVRDNKRFIQRMRYA